MLPQKRSLQSLDLHPSRGVAPSGFRPLWKIPHCCLPQEYGPCLSSIVTDHPLRPVIRHSLGKPLPYQQADRMQAPPPAINLYCRQLSGIKPSFPGLSLTGGQIPTRYSPVRRSQIKKSTEASFLNLPLDLHVLGAPLAFTLSQDQTLLNVFYKYQTYR